MGFSFDDLGRLSSIKNALGLFSYNYYGVTPRLQSVVYPLNSQVAGFAYFDSGNPQNQERLQTITNELGANIVSKFDYQYDVLGQITNWTRQFDNNPATFYKFQYDAVNQLVGAALTNGTPASPTTLVKQYIYSYDSAGNRTTMSLTNVSSTSTTAETAAYNNLNQLIKRTPGVRTNFAGTAVGVVTTTRSVAINGVPAPLAADNKTFQGYATVSTDNKIVQVRATDMYGNTTNKNYQLAVGANGTPTTLTYDLNGNLLSSVTGTTVTAYDWDGADRLVAITYRTGSAPGARTEFTYDGLGRRVRIVEKDATGAVTSEKRYVWDGMEICEERDASNAKLKQYFPQGAVIGGNNYYYNRDHLGSIRELVDSSGLIRARYDYDPYGQRGANQITASPVESDFGFTGFYYHTNSGLYFAQFRAYNAGAGRWLNRDPIEEEGGLNLYAYVGNNSINRVDPFGLLDVNTVMGAYYGLAYGQPTTASYLLQLSGAGEAMQPGPFGVGITGNAYLEGGYFWGGGANVNGGVGLFYNPRDGFSIGSFLSSGAFFGGPTASFNWPRNQCQQSGALGAYGGFGGGLFLSNAGSASDLYGPFNQWNFNSPVSVSYAQSGNTWIGSLTGGPGGIASLSQYPTTTWNTSGFNLNTGQLIPPPAQ